MKSYLAGILFILILISSVGQYFVFGFQQSIHKISSIIGRTHSSSTGTLELPLTQFNKLRFGKKEIFYQNQLMDIEHIEICGNIVYFEYKLDHHEQKLYNLLWTSFEKTKIPFESKSIFIQLTQNWYILPSLPKLFLLSSFDVTHNFNFICLYNSCCLDLTTPPPVG